VNHHISEIHSARERAEEARQGLAIPTDSDEGFRFVGPGDFFQAGVKSDESLAKGILLNDEEQGLLVLEGAHSRLEGKAASYLALLEKMPERLAFVERLRRPVFGEDQWAQTSASQWRSGSAVVVKSHEMPKLPLRVVSCFSEPLVHYRHWIELEEGAKATVVMEGISDGAAHAGGELLEVVLGQRANLHLVLLGHWGMETRVSQRHHYALGKDSHLEVSVVGIGPQRQQWRSLAQLGEGASYRMQGAVRGDGSQLNDFWAEVFHERSRSKSEMDLRFVQNGQSRSQFNGLIKVQPGALHCEASQKTKALLLSSKASMVAVPKLIIQTDEVKCSHGASISTLNPEQVHYLQSRGIPRSEAEQMIIEGFTQAALVNFPEGYWRTRAEELLIRRSRQWIQ
jgi:Fe-S cluster assembly protein SufD